MHAIPETGNDQHTTLVSIAALVVNPLESYGLDYRPRTLRQAAQVG